MNHRSQMAAAGPPVTKMPGGQPVTSALGGIARQPGANDIDVEAQAQLNVKLRVGKHSKFTDPFNLLADLLKPAQQKTQLHDASLLIAQTGELAGEGVFSVTHCPVPVIRSEP